LCDIADLPEDRRPIMRPTYRRIAVECDVERSIRG
jgi:hypothetical protein